MSGAGRKSRPWGVYATVAFGAVCVVWDLLLMKGGASAADIGFVATWQMIAYLAGCGVAFGVAPLIRRYAGRSRKGPGGTV